MKYLYDFIEDLSGNMCPTCEQKSWFVMQCKCGRVFCDKCDKDAFERNDETENIFVKCDCGDFVLLI